MQSFDLNLILSIVTEVRTLDELVVISGGCGVFQLMLVVCTYTSQICAVWGMLFMIFGNYHGAWRCESALVDPSYATSRGQLDTTTALSGNITTPPSDTIDSGATFLSNMSGVSSLKDIPASVLWNVSDMATSVIRGSNESVFVRRCPGEGESCRKIVYEDSSATAVTQWNLICDQSWVQSFIISIQMTGVLLGSYVSGFLGDRCGRRVSLYGSICLHAVFNFLIVFSDSWRVFLALRFLIGFCIGGVLTSYFLYPMEFVSSWWRAVLGALPVWNIGAATFSVMVYLLQDWRHIHLCTALLSLLYFLPVFWVPESLRWLAIHGHTDKAKRLVVRIARTNGRPSPPMSVLAMVSTEEVRRAANNRFSYTLMDLFVDPVLRKVSLVMGFVWACLALVYYSLSFGIKALSGDFYVNFLLFSVAEVPGMLFVAPASNKLGRRVASVLYFLLIGSACIAVVFVSFLAPEEVRGQAITILAMVAKVHIQAVWMIVTLFCSELYPTVVRNQSSGFLNACARLGGIAAPYLIPGSEETLYISFLVMGISCLLCGLMLLTLKETKGNPLDDVIKTRHKLSVIAEETEEDLSDDGQL
ncbi:solute carrier family 22 member 15-like [Aplysia californica]|uniref:Solute carrier family 22 member 15-like n=1 Tax=Aplysia californica TaxID=6500 RepID=A0ABM0JD62_APLCA|nr:solute carrier family 22 member 15-like [Aplysia californica]